MAWAAETPPITLFTRGAKLCLYSPRTSKGCGKKGPNKMGGKMNGQPSHVSDGCGQLALGTMYVCLHAEAVTNAANHTLGGVFNGVKQKR